VPIDTTFDVSSLVYTINKGDFPIEETHKSHVISEFQQVHLLGLKCTPLLGASFLVLESILLCARSLVWEVFLLRI
jgi:hypothetical protein